MSTETPVQDWTADTTLAESIERAATTVGSAWPLHSFVTANPLAGFEDRPFPEAVRRGAELFGGRGYPSAATFRQAWSEGRIDPDVLRTELSRTGYDPEPEALLDRMESEQSSDVQDAEGETATDRVDRILTKWLAVFLDEGHAEWSMPDRDRGFYAAFRTVAQYDRELPDRSALSSYPADPAATIEHVLADVPAERWESVFEQHLAALPGWTGLIKRRADGDGDWQSSCPITLVEYLAVRLVLTDLLDAPIDPTDGTRSAADEESDENDPLPEVWLTAWERTYREQLVDAVSDAADEPSTSDDDQRPAAQLVFCIDTRSEIIRHHIEQAGPYETYGYAGFFGVPMRYQGYNSDGTVDACPPIVDPQHCIEDRPADEHDHERASHDRFATALDAGRGLIETLASNAATAFSFVESAGSGYGIALAARTLLPTAVYDALDAADEIGRASCRERV